MNRRSFLRATAAAAIALPVWACSGGAKDPPTGKPSPSSSSAPLTEAAKGGLQIGDQIPTVTEEAVEGPPIDTAEFRGRPLLINFWASDCAPCQRELPLLKRALERHSDLPILGIAVLDRKPDAQRFIQQADITWPSIWDPDGSVSAKFRVKGLPVTYAVGRDFALVDRIFGEVDRNRLDSMIEAILRS